MSEFEATAVLVALFALRCVVPLVLVFVVGYFMNRLADRWREADELQLAPETTADVQPAVGDGRRRSLPVITIPCWILRNCEPEARSECPAYQKPGLPCWMARSSINGLVPAACADCPLYNQAFALA